MWKIGIAVAVLTVAACEATYEERAAAFYKAQAICQAQVLAGDSPPVLPMRSATLSRVLLASHRI